MLPTTGIHNKFEIFTYENFDGHGVYGFLFFFLFLKFFLMRLEFDG